MFVNTKIVNALLTLRCIPRTQLCAVTGISIDALSAWLDETSEESDDRLPFDRQLEVLKVLGVVGDNPRRDVVHYWKINEPVFGSADSAYDPLRLILSCFGRAEVVHLAPERDTFYKIYARTFFGLTFAKFRAILEVNSAPFKTLTFNPDSLPNLSWAATGSALVVTQDKFKQLTAPGDATPALFDNERVAALEHYQWQKLISLTQEKGVNATDVVKLVIESIPDTPALPGPRPSRRKTRSSTKKNKAAKPIEQKEAGSSASSEKTTSQEALDPQPVSHT